VAPLQQITKTCQQYIHQAILTNIQFPNFGIASLWKTSLKDGHHYYRVTSQEPAFTDSSQNKVQCIRLEKTGKTKANPFCIFNLF
jgi:hypothetical protein